MVAPLLVSVGGSALIGLVSGLTQRFSAKYITTPMETAQISNMVENLALQKERLRIEEERFVRQMGETRRLQMQKIQADSRQNISNRQMDRWPLQVMAYNILKQAASLNSQGLTVVLKSTQQEPAAAGTPAPFSRRLLMAASESAVRRVERTFARRICVFNELHVPTQMQGWALNSTLYGLMSSIPVVLVEARASTSMKFHFAISIWGWDQQEAAFVDSANAIAHQDDDLHSPVSEISYVTFDLSQRWATVDRKNLAEVEAASRDIEEQLSDALCAMLTQLMDVFGLLRRPHEPARLELPFLMSEINVSMVKDGLKEIVDAYVGINDPMSESAPALASEVAADMALGAQQGGQPEFANLLLDKAVRYYGKGLRPALGNDVKLLQAIMTSRRGAAATRLQEALRQLRGATLHPEPDARNAAMTIEQMCAMGLRSV